MPASPLHCPSDESPASRRSRSNDSGAIVSAALDSRAAGSQNSPDGAHPTPPTDTLPFMLTERELAALLRCNARTVRRLEKRGELPAAVRIGGFKRWRLDVISAWLDSLRQEPAE